MCLQNTTIITIYSLANMKNAWAENLQLDIKMLVMFLLSKDQSMNMIINVAGWNVKLIDWDPWSYPGDASSTTPTPSTWPRGS